MKKYVIRVQLVRQTNPPDKFSSYEDTVVRSFDAEIPKHIRGVESEAEFLRASKFYEKLQKTFKGKASKHT